MKETPPREKGLAYFNQNRLEVYASGGDVATIYNERPPTEAITVANHHKDMDTATNPEKQDRATSSSIPGISKDCRKKAGSS